MKIVIVGRNGQVAWELRQHLVGLGEILTAGRPEMDLANPSSVRRTIRELSPDVLINAAAYTAVDQAQAEPSLATACNEEAPRVMAEEIKRLNALFIHYSTDYVYDGSKASPYVELDVPNPLNVYGTSKLAGDQAIEAAGGAFLIFRTSWVYGSRGKNFLLTIMKLAAERDELRVVDDQWGAPTSSRDIAEATRSVVSRVFRDSPEFSEFRDWPGIYNMTAQGSVSWYGFAVAIVEKMRHSGINEKLARIEPISSGERAAAAVRPKNSRLANEKLHRVFGVMLPDWKISLNSVMEEVMQANRLNSF